MNKIIRQLPTIIRFESGRILTSWKIVASVVATTLLMLVSYNAILDQADDPNNFIYPMVASMALVISIYAATSASDIISDEFEKRSGLVMMTQPVNRYILFIGKFISLYLVGTMLVTLCYMIMVTLCHTTYGHVPHVLWESYALAMLYLFAAIGICITVSALSPSSSLSITVCLIIMVIPLFFFQNVTFDSEPWYVIWYDSRIISNHILGIETIFDSNMLTDDYQPLLSTATYMMGLYGVITTALSSVLFRYRQI